MWEMDETIKTWKKQALPMSKLYMLWNDQQAIKRRQYFLRQSYRRT